MSKKTNSAMLLDVFHAIIELCEKDTPVQFQRDLGRYSLTVFIGDRHTHIGVPELNDEAFDVLIRNLHDLFTGGPHLSMA